MTGDWKNLMIGLKSRELSTGFSHLRVHYTADEDKRGDWNIRHSVFYGGMESTKWRREMEIDYFAYSGQRIWPMLNSIVHDFRVDHNTLCREWTLFRVIDQGMRHPTVCLWVAVNPRGDRHIYREFYSVNRSIAQNCRQIIQLTGNEPIISTYIDPSTRRRSEENLTPLINVYGNNGIYCYPADNSFAGYDAVATAATSTLARSALRGGVLPNFLAKLEPNQDQLLLLANKPALTFDLRFTSRCFDECYNLRWKESHVDPAQTSQKEKPVDVNDDGPDCVRYSIQSELFCRRRSNIISFGDYRRRKEIERGLKLTKAKYERRGYVTV